MQCGYTEVNPGPKYSSLTFCDWNLSSLTAHDTKVHVPQYNEISLFNDPLWNIFRSYIPNHMHVNKVGHASEFPFNIYWWTLKNPKNQNEKNCWRCRHFIHVYQKQQSYEVQFLIYRVRPFFLVILGHFFPLPQNKHLEMSFYSFYTCALQMTIMMYGSWDIKHGKTFLSFRAIFYLFTPPSPKNPENQNLKKWKKKLLEVLHFTHK